MTDYHKFVHALEVYLSLYEKAKDNKEERKRINEDFILSIKDLKCNDFRFFYFMARYKNGKGQLDEARTYIDKSIECLTSIKEQAFKEENSQWYLLPVEMELIYRCLCRIFTYNWLTFTLVQEKFTGS